MLIYVSMGVLISVSILNLLFICMLFEALSREDIQRVKQSLIITVGNALLTWLMWEWFFVYVDMAKLISNCS